MTNFQTELFYFLSHVNLNVLCLGKFTSPPEGEKFNFSFGSNDNITWTFDNSASSISEVWCEFNNSKIEQIDLTKTPNCHYSIKTNFALRKYRIDIQEKKIILFLFDIDRNHHGKYSFYLEEKKSKSYSRSVTVNVTGTSAEIFKRPSLLDFCSKTARKYINTCITTKSRGKS